MSERKKSDYEIEADLVYDLGDKVVPELIKIIWGPQPRPTREEAMKLPFMQDEKAQMLYDIWTRPSKPVDEKRSNRCRRLLMHWPMTA